MTICNLSPPRLPMRHDQQSMMLRWRSFSSWGMEGIAIYWAYKGSQKFHSQWLHTIGGVISQDAWPKIVDAPLALVFMKGQGGYCYLFYLWRQPIIPLWLTTTYWRCDVQGRMTKNRWCSVEAHFHDWAGRVLLSVLPIKAAKNCFVTDYNLSKVCFPTTHEQKSLMLRWHSFCHYCILNMEWFNFV
jgi:hypothetical protein